MSFFIGANDAANSWATSVGSGALPLRAALILGGSMEWAGALSLGYGVAKTVTKGTAKVTDPYCFACGYCDSHMTVFMIGMMSALFSAALFLLLATATAMPVSTTHAIIGAVVGSTVSGVGFGCLEWKFDGGLSGIIASWVISPVVSGLIAVGCYYVTYYTILEPCALMRRLGMSSRRTNALWGQPILMFVQTFVLVFLILLKSKPTKKWEIGLQAGIAMAIAGGVGIAALVFWRPFLRYNLPSSKRLRAMEGGGQEEEAKHPTTGIRGAAWRLIDYLLLRNEPFIDFGAIFGHWGAALERRCPAFCCVPFRLVGRLFDGVGYLITCGNRCGGGIAPSADDDAIAADEGDDTKKPAARAEVDGVEMTNPSKVTMDSEAKVESTDVPPSDEASSTSDSDVAKSESALKSASTLLSERDENIKKETETEQKLALDTLKNPLNKERNQAAKADLIGGVVRTMTPHRLRTADEESEDALWTFSWLLVFTAAWESFAHGANDTGNATGAFTGVYTVYANGVGGDSCSKGDTPVWIMAIAGFFVALGIVIAGYRVISTIGFKLTNINFQRGYCVEFGSTLSVVIATLLELPVSTTHCQVGAVVFVGTAAFGPRNVAWGLFIKIAIAWVVTVPLSAVISGALTAAFRQAVN
jgi:phosphate/sulfate permease